MRFENELRSLACSFYWQRLYMSSKELSGIHLFENNTNFSGFQVMFLYWLEIYTMLYRELAIQEWTNLDEEVIKDLTRCNAFLYWRQREQEKKINQTNQELKHSTSGRKSLKNGSGKDFQIFQGAKNKGGN